MENDKVNLANLVALIAILDTTFGNLNRIAEAESKLLTLQQGAMRAAGKDVNIVYSRKFISGDFREVYGK